MPPKKKSKAIVPAAPANDPENVKLLIDEIDAIETNFKTVGMIETIRRNMLIGEAITHSPLYQKNAKGNQSLIQKVAIGTALKAGTLYACIRMYEEYGPEKGETIEKAVSNIFKKFGSSRKAVAALMGDTSDGEEKEGSSSEKTCKHCPVHCGK